MRVPYKDDFLMRRFLALIIVTTGLTGCLDSVEPEVLYEWNGGVDADTPELDRRFEAAFAWYENQQVFVAAAGVRGDEPDASRAWQIRSGTCSTGGPVVGQSGAYPHLLVNDGGEGRSDTGFNILLDPALDYHASFLESSDENAAVIACADMTLLS